MQQRSPLRKKAHQDRLRRRETRVERVNRGIVKRLADKQRILREMAERAQEKWKNKSDELHQLFGKHDLGNARKLYELFDKGQTDARRGIDSAHAARMTGRDGREYEVSFSGLKRKWTHRRIGK